jgi:hypothetical protein
MRHTRAIGDSCAGMREAQMKQRRHGVLLSGRSARGGQRGNPQSARTDAAINRTGMDYAIRTYGKKRRRECEQRDIAFNAEN